MSKLHHFSRKQRQLKNKLKAYQRSLNLNSNTNFEELKAQIFKLLPFANRKLVRVAFALGIMISPSASLSAQDILLNPPQSIRGDNNFFNTTDSTSPILIEFALDELSQVKFIDVDNDGDMDAFYKTFNEGCLNCYYDYNPAYRKLYFQENVSTANNVVFANPIELLDIPEDIFAFDFQVADFDNDSDYDLYIGNFIGVQIFENSSGVPKVFNYDSPNQSNGLILNFFNLELFDVDLDGDLDFTFLDVYDNTTLSYVENNGNIDLFPFSGFKQTFNIDVNIPADNLSYSRSFADIDGDGNQDLLIQGNFEDDDGSGGYNYTTEARLYYHKNNSSTSYDFELDGELLLERDLLTPLPESADGSNSFTFFNAVDFDGDGDIDINENETIALQGCGYCGIYGNMRNVLIYENVIEEITTIDNKINGITFNLFPNPSNQKININFENAYAEKIQISVFDLTGKLVFQDETNTNIFEIEKNDLKSGLYTFSIISEDKTANGQFIFTE